MRNYKFWIVIFSIFLFVSGFLEKEKATVEPQTKLSDYNFFEGTLANQIPTKELIPYSLNTPLFSDYAEKLRFVKIPEGQSVVYKPNEVFDFPIGTVIIKTFYFPNDFRDLSKGRKLLETRLLIHEEKAWKALTYIWNEQQTDAFLEVAGDTKEVNYIGIDGKKQSLQYIIPNQNQCKGCHNRNEILTPIGPSARQLNGEYNYEQGTENQLINWTKNGALKNMPALQDCPKMPTWNQPETGTLAERARAYLDINCAHCHNPKGPAMTSGLNLGMEETNETAFG
ncbi:MAG: SO2930 family diheme c-type cytochrome, partial [Bacteroidota bacterium]